jgi:hypothetical protein
MQHRSTLQCPASSLPMTAARALAPPHEHCPGLWLMLPPTSSACATAASNTLLADWRHGGFGGRHQLLQLLRPSGFGGQQCLASSPSRRQEGSSLPPPLWPEATASSDPLPPGTMVVIRTSDLLSLGNLLPPHPSSCSGLGLP